MANSSLENTNHQQHKKTKNGWRTEPVQIRWTRPSASVSASGSSKVNLSECLTPGRTQGLCLATREQLGGEIQITGDGTIVIQLPVWS